jgi:hypothetical protein
MAALLVITQMEEKITVTMNSKPFDLPENINAANLLEATSFAMISFSGSWVSRRHKRTKELVYYVVVDVYVYECRLTKDIFILLGIEQEINFLKETVKDYMMDNDKLRDDNSL